MKHRRAFISVIGLTLAALIVAERRKVNAPVSPDPTSYSAADTEKELGRLAVAVTRLSDNDGIQIGDELARQAIASFSDNYRRTDPEVAVVESYLKQAGLRVAAHAHRKLPYRFHYIPQPYFINAFALPGGHVLVGAGMLDLMDSEDECRPVAWAGAGYTRQREDDGCLPRELDYDTGLTMTKAARPRGT